VIGLPDSIRPYSFASMNQVERLAVGLGSEVSKRQQTSGKFADQVVDRPVSRDGLATCLCELPHLAIDVSAVS